jgi:hypothetical protein
MKSSLKNWSRESVQMYRSQSQLAPRLGTSVVWISHKTWPHDSVEMVHETQSQELVPWLGRNFVWNTVTRNGPVTRCKCMKLSHKNWPHVSVQMLHGTQSQGLAPCFSTNVVWNTVTKTGPISRYKCCMEHSHKTGLVPRCKCMKLIYKNWFHDSWLGANVWNFKMINLATAGNFVGSTLSTEGIPQVKLGKQGPVSSVINNVVLLRTSVVVSSARCTSVMACST